MTSPTQRAGADVQRYFPVPRNATMLKLDGEVSGGYVAADDHEKAIAALQARIAELEAREHALQLALSRWLPEIAGDDSRGPMYAAASEDALLLMGLCEATECYGQQIMQRAEAAEARNAASERDAVLVPREATSKMMDRAVAAMHAAPVDWRGRQGHAAFRAGYAAALDAAIDAHAQGQAGEGKDG